MALWKMDAEIRTFHEINSLINRAATNNYCLGQLKLLSVYGKHTKVKNTTRIPCF